MIKLLWALPTLISILLVEASIHTGFMVPVPFFTIIICVNIAGALGGQRSGFVAGIIASIFLVRSYFIQFGPPPLTGGLPQVAIGSVLFLMIGFLLGRLRDQRDSSIRSLLENEKKLEAALLSETAQKELESAKVVDREARLEAAIRIAGIGHFTFDTATGNCTFCSEQFAAHLGVTPAEYCERIAGPVAELFYVHEDDHKIVRDAIDRITAGEAQTFEYRVLHKDGTIRYIRQFEEPNFDTNGKVFESAGASIDLTELREAEARARQSQRIEAIGTLTGGVAHDFNNLLAVILGNLELSLEANQEDDRKKLIQSSIKATMRGAGLTKNLLSFARRAHLLPTRLNLNQLIQNTMEWSSRVLPKTIAVENSLMAGLWEVELDATSAETALINILLNARDAMPDGGKVTIETANMRIGEEYVADRDEDIEPGRYVMLAITDTGHGIHSNNFQKIFEPFYTEKPTGLGSGLGLSMVQGFIKQSGGAIRIYSEVGVGTTFKLYFKATEQGTDKASKAQNSLLAQLQTQKDQVSILFAEDEEEVMNVLNRILAEAGYSVTTAVSGDAALEIFTASDRFDLLLTDVVMPGTLQGPALAKAIRLLQPNLPCIFLSGYASEATVHGNGLRPSDIRLMKPINRLDLLSAVAKALESNKTPD